MAFLEQTIVPVEFNDTNYCIDLSAMAEEHDISVTIKEDPAVYYTAVPDSRQWYFTDDIHLYLRKMPVEKGDMYPMFVTLGGSKLPQNYYHYDIPYMQNESCIVLSDRGEPTLGRDKIVRDDNFNRIKKSVETARCQALIQLFEKSATANSQKPTDYADNMATANIYAMRSLLAKRIQSDNSFIKDKGHCTHLLDSLIQYPLFSTFDGPARLSIDEILSSDPKGGVFFYAKSPDSACFLNGAHCSPFILKEEIHYYDELWGGHEYRIIDTVLKPLLEQIKGLEFVSMDELFWNEKKLDELEERGIISRSPIKIRHISSPDKTITEFLDRLKLLLNRPWFRHSLVRFHPPRKIRLLPIKVQQSTISGEIVAAVLNGTDGDQDNLNIGICMDSLPMRSIIKDKNGELAALPIICHELIHHRRKLVDENDGHNAHNDNFHLDRIQLEDKVLKNCVLHLLGKDEELIQGSGMLTDASDILVL